MGPEIVWPSAAEWACHCGRCDSKEPHPDLRQLVLDIFWDFHHKGIPGKVWLASAVRCPTWNAEVGGSKHSTHLAGIAADLHVLDENGKRAPELLFRAIRGFLYEPIMGFGIYPWGFHVDLRRGKFTAWKGGNGSELALF